MEHRPIPDGGGELAGGADPLSLCPLLFVVVIDLGVALVTLPGDGKDVLLLLELHLLGCGGEQEGEAPQAHQSLHPGGDGSSLARL